MKLLSFGEILWDIFPDKKHIGGAALNFAAHFAKFHEEAYMLSSLGKDDLGAEAFARLAELSLNTEYVSLSDTKETGKCVVSLTSDGLPSYEISPDSAYDEIDCEKVSGSFDALYFGTLALRYEYNRKSLLKLMSRSSFSEVFVDVNIRKPHISYESLLFGMKSGTIVKISDEELPFVSSLLFKEELAPTMFAQKVHESFENVKILIITLGDKGSVSFNFKTGELFNCPSVKVKVKATVGAGDSFSAAFLYEYLSGAPIPKALEKASKVAAFVVSKTEAVPDYDPFLL